VVSPLRTNGLPANFLIRREVTVGIRRLDNLKSAGYREVGLAWLCWLRGANYAARFDRCVLEPASCLSRLEKGGNRLTEKRNEHQQRLCGMVFRLLQTSYSIVKAMRAFLSLRPRWVGGNLLLSGVWSRLER
jgi:hypothetical protein